MQDYYLKKGSHPTSAEGRCAMEWVSYLANEPHSDQPLCVSPELRNFCMALNDCLEEEPRQKLRPYLARTIGTHNDGFDTQRAWLALDWLCRIYTPTWLHLAKLDKEASNLKTLQPINSQKSLEAARESVAKARQIAINSGKSLSSGICSDEGSPHWRAAWATRKLSGIEAVEELAGEASENAKVITGNTLWASHWATAVASSRKVNLLPTALKLQDSVFKLLDKMLPTTTIEILDSQKIPEPSLNI